MAMNGTYLARAREALEQRRVQNEAERARREREIHAKIPRTAEIDETLRAQMLELFGYTLRHGTDPTPDLRALEEKNLALQAERAALLEQNGFAADYTEPIFTCPDCGDTGYRPDGSVCGCLTALYNAETTRDLATLLRTGEEAFENFDLSLYEGAARAQMEKTLEFCRDYARGFTPDAPNLLFWGGTGLGKTFLSGCIAREVAAQDYAVAYETASAALGAFETAKFQRFGEQGEQAAAKVEQYLSCDLMILDDLGTEMISPYSVSALYTLINSRLTNRKATILSTNLQPEELARSYSPQILSRIRGDYMALHFVGRDIRQVKKERGL